jgi:dihydrodipicolinate synthase/N-acetylneuraminate lyase
MMTRLGLLPAPEVRLPLVAINDDEDRARRLDDVLRRSGLLSAVTA